MVTIRRGTPTGDKRSRIEALIEAPTPAATSHNVDLSAAQIRLVVDDSGNVRSGVARAEEAQFFGHQDKVLRLAQTLGSDRDRRPNVKPARRRRDAIVFFELEIQGIDTRVLDQDGKRTKPVIRPLGVPSEDRGVNAETDAAVLIHDLNFLLSPQTFGPHGPRFSRKLSTLLLRAFITKIVLQSYKSQFNAVFVKKVVAAESGLHSLDFVSLIVR